MRLFILAAMVLLGNSGFTQDADSLTIEQLASQVRNANGQLSAAYLMEQSTTATARSVGRWPDPMLMLGIQNSPKDFDLEKDPMTMRVIGLTQEIPYSGSRTLQRRASLLAVDESRLDRLTIQRELVFRASLLYCDLWLKRQQLDLLNEQHSLQSQIVEATLAALETNRSSQADVLEAQSELWRIEASLNSMQQEIDPLELRLNALRAADPDHAIPRLTLPPDAGDSVDLATLLHASEQAYPPLARLAVSKNRLQYEAEATRRMRWPMLSLSAEYGIRTGQEVGLHGDPEGEREDMVSLSASFNIPLFSRGTQGRMAQSMEAMALGRTAEADQLKREIESTLRSLVLRIERTRANLGIYETKIIPVANELIKTKLAEMETSRSTLKDLLTARMSLISDESVQLQLKAELARTWAEIQLYTDPIVDEPHTLLEKQ